MGELAVFSEQARPVVERERAVVLARVEDLRRQSAALHAVVTQIDELLREERLLRRMDELPGLAPQLALEATDGELRGQRLREIAVSSWSSAVASGKEL